MLMPPITVALKAYFQAQECPYFPLGQARFLKFQDAKVVFFDLPWMVQPNLLANRAAVNLGGVRDDDGWRGASTTAMPPLLVHSTTVAAGALCHFSCLISTVQLSYPRKILSHA